MGAGLDAVLPSARKSQFLSPTDVSTDEKDCGCSPIEHFGFEAAHGEARVVPRVQEPQSAEEVRTRDEKGQLRKDVQVHDV